MSCGCPLRRYGVAAASVLTVAMAVRCVVIPLRRAIRRKRAAEVIKAQKKDVVYLYGFTVHGATNSFSAPVLKVETFIRMCKIPYEYIVGQPDDSPTGRIPYIVFNGQIVAESDIIIDFLRSKFPDQDPDKALTTEQRAEGLAVRRMLEFHASQCQSRSMMVDRVRDVTAVFASIFKMPPWLVYVAFTRPYRRNTITMLNLTGVGDLTQKQFEARHVEDLAAVATLVGKKRFLLGDTPTSYDVAIFAHLYVARLMASFISGGLPPAFVYLMQSQPLQAYIENVKALIDMDAI